MEGKMEELPKWAQRHIEALKKAVSSLTNDLNAMSSNDHLSNTSVEVGSIGQVINLPKDSDVRFKLSNVDDKFHSEILCGIKYSPQFSNNILRINGGHTFLVYPRASNSIDIVFAE